MPKRKDGGPYEASGSLLHLATHFQSRGLGPQHLENMHPQVRQHYAKSAGLNNPSDDEWQAVIDHMKKTPTL
jgi:hypothetical protein